MFVLISKLFLCPEPIFLRCAEWAAPLLPQKARGQPCKFFVLRFGVYGFHKFPLTIMGSTEAGNRQDARAIAEPLHRNAKLWEYGHRKLKPGSWTAVRYVSSPRIRLVSEARAMLAGIRRSSRPRSASIVISVSVTSIVPFIGVLTRPIFAEIQKLSVDPCQFLRSSTNRIGMVLTP
jgi:hypothetical protein